MTLHTIVIFTLLFVAACWDFRRRKVPNILLFPVMLIGLVYQFIYGDGLVALMGLAAAFALTFFPVVVKGMGMGDQKLLMAVGVFLPASEIYILFLYSICVGLLFALFTPHRWSQVHNNMKNLAAGWVAHRVVWMPNLKKSALTLPYAGCLFIAYLYLLFVEGRYS